MKHYRPLLFLAIFCLCLAAGFWAGRQVRNSTSTRISLKTPTWPANPANAISAGESLPAPTSAPDTVPTYPVPAVTMPPVLSPTSTPPPAAVPTATQPPPPTPTSSPVPQEVRQATAPASQPTPETALVVEPEGSQRNVLVITVDDLHAQPPRLISVWLVLYVTSTPHFTLMPVYPQVVPQDYPSSPPQQDTLAQVFSLSPDGDPSSEFLQALIERGAWWNASILLDRTVAESVLDIAYGGEHLPDIEVLLPAFSTNLEEAQDVLLAQAWLGTQFCQNLADPRVDDTPRLLNLLSFIPAHLRTDMDLQFVRDELESILQQGTELICEIPVLSGGGIEP